MKIQFTSHTIFESYTSCVAHLNTRLNVEIHKQLSGIDSILEKAKALVPTIEFDYLNDIDISSFETENGIDRVVLCKACIIFTWRNQIVTILSVEQSMFRIFAGESGYLHWQWKFNAHTWASSGFRKGYRTFKVLKDNLRQFLSQYYKLQNESSELISCNIYGKIDGFCLLSQVKENEKVDRRENRIPICVAAFEDIDTNLSEFESIVILTDQDHGKFVARSSLVKYIPESSFKSTFEEPEDDLTELMKAIQNSYLLSALYPPFEIDLFARYIFCQKRILNGIVEEKSKMSQVVTGISELLSTKNIKEYGEKWSKVNIVEKSAEVDIPTSEIDDKDKKIRLSSPLRPKGK